MQDLLVILHARKCKEYAHVVQNNHMRCQLEGLATL